MDYFPASTFPLRRPTSARPTGECDHALLEWWDGQGLVLVTARLIAVWRGGVRIVGGTPPPPGQSVWLRVMKPRPTGWTLTRATRVEGPRGFDLSFPGACPKDLVGTAAVLGCFHPGGRPHSWADRLPDIPGSNI